MRVTILGSGTSTGVPVLGCSCPVCLSTDPRNKRLRASIYIETEDRQGEPFAILVDSSPDLRYQMLRLKKTRLDAVLYTHTHADHLFGIDDLRVFNFISNKDIPVFATENDLRIITNQFPYCFKTNKHYQGGGVPRLTPQSFTHNREFDSGAATKILPLRLNHGTMPVTGFRIGEFAYLTDCSHIPEVSKKQLEGIEVLVIDGLRIRPHRTHFTFEQACREAEEIGATTTYLTHISHDLDHHEANDYLKTLTDINISLAYDGLVIEV